MRVATGNFVLSITFHRESWEITKISKTDYQGKLHPVKNLRICLAAMSAITESVLTIMTSHVCCEKYSDLQRFKAGSLLLVRQHIANRFYNITTSLCLKVSDAKERLLRNTCIRLLYIHSQAFSFTAVVVFVRLSVTYCTDTTLPLRSSRSAPHETRNPGGVMWNKCLHPSWKFLLFQRCDVLRK